MRRERQEVARDLLARADRADACGGPFSELAVDILRRATAIELRGRCGANDNSVVFLRYPVALDTTA